MAQIQKLSRIEKIPKKVIKLRSYRKAEVHPQNKRELLARQIKKVQEDIENGRGLEESFYRKFIDDPTKPDHLLDDCGIMHIHILEESCSELLYIAQYTRFVTVLELTDHRHFDAVSRPHSKELMIIHGDAMLDAERLYDAQVRSFLNNFSNDNIQ